MAGPGAINLRAHWTEGAMTFDRAAQDFSPQRDEITKPGALNDRTAGQAVIEKLLGDREGGAAAVLLGTRFWC